MGRLCLINQATTKIWGRNTSEMAEIERGGKIKQPHCHSEGVKRVLNEVKELKLLRFTQDELRIWLRTGSVRGNGLRNWNYRV